MGVGSARRSIVLGANGQDGSILVEQLLARGDTVMGVGRQPGPRFALPQEQFQYRCVDLCTPGALAAALREFRPSQAYHLAAIHGADGFPYEAVWADALAVNVGALHTVLEYARVHDPRLRIAYASSSKVFGTPLHGAIDEATPRRSECLYSITKNSAEQLIDHYAREHAIFGAVAYLFNHESERRGAQYFIPTISSILARALEDRDYRQSVRTLDFYCDWGSAHDYMQWFRELLELEAPHKVIFATGEVRYGRDFVAQLFARHGLVAADHVIENACTTDSEAFTVSVSKRQSLIAQDPCEDVFAVCDRILSTLSAPRLEAAGREN